MNKSENFPTGHDVTESPDAVITREIIRGLGKPTSPYWVQVRRLWGNQYRVNVLVGDDIASARVAHSYFLSTGNDGTITESNPKITRKY